MDSESVDAEVARAKTAYVDAQAAFDSAAAKVELAIEAFENAEIQ